MKPFYLSVLFVTYSIFCHSQVAYYDASTIRDKYVSIAAPPATGFSFKPDAASVSALTSLLRNYMPEPQRSDPKLTEGMVLQAYTSNPFFGTEISTMLAGASIQPTGFSKILSNAGSLDVTAFADGMAQFLVQRTREELNVAFFEKFREEMNHYPELKFMFPKTIGYIGEIPSYKVSVILNDLRDAFLEDLNALPEHFLEFAEKDGSVCPATDASCISRMQLYNTFFKTDAGLSVLCAVDLADGVRAGKNMRELLERLANNPYALRYANANVKSVYQFAGILSGALLSKDSTRIWITYKELQDAIKDPIELRIFSGLLYKQIEVAGITNLAGVPTNQLFSNVASNMLQMEAFMTSVLIASDKLNNIKLHASNGVVSFTDYYKFSKGIIGFLRVANPGPILYPVGGFSANNYSDFLDIADYSTDLIYNVNEKKYGLAVNNVVNMFSRTIILSGLSENNTTVAIKKYGGFIAKVANLTDAKDVKEAIAEIALPVGSSAMKKRTASSISLNAYVAPFGGAEIFPHKKSDSKFATDIKAVTGIYAPIGFGFNWGLWKGKKSNISPTKKAGSVSLFFPIIDIGAIVAYRFDDDSTSVAENVKIRLGDIFSPGVNLFFGMPRVPLSLGIGANWMPTLAKFYTDKSADLRPNGFRVFATLAVDIPVFHFYNKETR